MPLEYSVDVAERTVRLRCVDPLLPGDVAAVLERQIREGYWRYATLVDARLAGLNAAQSAALFEHVNALIAEHGANGPVALVTRKQEYVGGAQIIAARGAGIAMNFEVFWDIDDAIAWLRAQPRR